MAAKQVTCSIGSWGRRGRKKQRARRSRRFKLSSTSSAFCTFSQLEDECAFGFWRPSICRLSALRRISSSAPLSSEQCQRVKRRNERCGKKISISVIELRRRAREQSDRRVIAAFSPGSLREAIHFAQRHKKKKKRGKKKEVCPTKLRN